MERLPASFIAKEELFTTKEKLFTAAKEKTFTTKERSFTTNSACDMPECHILQTKQHTLIVAGRENGGSI